MISIEVQDSSGGLQTIDIPEEINLSLMEVLKASEYAVKATCGGMALCATCHVEVIDGGEDIDLPNDAELDMIDTLPNATDRSRLACQIRMSEKLNGTRFLLKEVD
jgi:2Fe-2S ferredoxin